MKLFAPTIHAVLVAVATTGNVCAGESSESGKAAPLPADWLSPWNEPPLEDRPLQIIHGIPPSRATKEGMRYYVERGLGGVVCNVAFGEYLRSEANWKTLIAGVEACEELGMVVWLYDEHGYPSGAAGGLVLEENRAYEALELAFDPSRDDPFILRPSYEHTHASNNFHMARRYPNLIDDRAVRCFIGKTHAAYRQRLAPHFGKTIRAVFTDEPSLLAVNLGQLPDRVRKQVRVADPIDPNVKSLPAVPWCYDLPQRYRERYGEDLIAERRSLFVGDAAEDRKVRRQFWSLIADLIAGRYFGAIGEWCGRHAVASSGHGLWEEELLHHVPLEGNGLKVLSRMDIPGLDMLSSDPEVVIHSGWLTAAMPASAAMLTGRRRVMTEVSDFIQKMGDRGPVTLAEMQATAAWQASWGVTEFTLYYGIGDRSAEDHRAYCDYVGRLNAVLKPARPDPEVLLYYPIIDLMEEYRPVAGPLKQKPPSARAQRIIGSFMQLGQRLQRNQVPFCLIDHERLAAAKVLTDGKLALGERNLTTLILPEGVRLPPAAAETAKRMDEAGGRVIRPEAGSTVGSSREPLLAKTRPAIEILPPSDRIALGRFVRGRHRILLIVNVARQAYDGHLATGAPGTWWAMDPATGSIRPVQTDRAGRIPISLPPRTALFVTRAVR